MPRDTVRDGVADGGVSQWKNRDFPPMACEVLVSKVLRNMLKSLANMLRKKRAKKNASGHGLAGISDENTPIYESLAMTPELREALFPTSPQMVSAIFKHPPPPLTRPPATPPPPPASEGGSFLIF